MLDFQLAPFIIAGLVIVTGYMSMRWLSNLGELRQWKDLAANLQDNIDGMREEGCAAQGALENIFNGATAGGMPHSKLVQRIAQEAADTLAMAPRCGHKALNEAMTEDYSRQNEELLATRLSLENHQMHATFLRERAEAAEGRAEEAERLLRLANDRLVIAESYDSQADERLQ